MVRFNEGNGYFYSTDQGRIASHFYIKYDTIEVINENFKVLRLIRVFRVPGCKINCSITL